MEGTKEEGWEKSLANKQVTFVVYREGDQLNFFRVVDRGDGTLTLLSESLRSASCHEVCFVFSTIVISLSLVIVKHTTLSEIVNINLEHGYFF